MGNLNQAMVKGAKAYQGQKIADRNTMVVKYSPLVKRVALHLKSRLPSYVDVNDLIQSGMIGLMDAIQNFRDGQGATFETYAAIRIRGSIIDELRQSDWTPRSVHQNTRTIREAYARLAHTLGRKPTEAEMAADLKIDINKFHQMMLDSNTSQVMGIEDTGLSDDAIGEHTFSDLSFFGPDDKLFEVVNDEQFKESLASSIQRLPDRERTIIGLYYDQEMNLREIGMIMGISESRTCQVLAQAVARLRYFLDEWSNASKEQPKIDTPYRKAAAEITKKYSTTFTHRKSSLFNEEGEVDEVYYNSNPEDLKGPRSPELVGNSSYLYGEIGLHPFYKSSVKPRPPRVPDEEKVAPPKTSGRRGRPSTKAKSATDSVSTSTRNASTKEPTSKLVDKYDTVPSGSAFALEEAYNIKPDAAPKRGRGRPKTVKTEGAVPDSVPVSTSTGRPRGRPSFKAAMAAVENSNGHINTQE